MNAVLVGLNETPWWLFVVFVVIIGRGAVGLRARTMPFTKLAVVPLLFCAWGLYSVIVLFSFNWRVVVMFCAATAAGCVAGYAVSLRGRVAAGQRPGTVVLSGSPLTLLAVAVVFTGKYLLGAWDAADRYARFTMGYWGIDAIMTGLVVGIFIGRFFGLWLRYATARAAMLAPQAASTSETGPS